MNDRFYWLPDGVGHCAEQVPGLKRSLARYGQPPTWGRKPGFETLAAIILEQQVSLDAAAEALSRLKRQLGGSLSPGGILGLDANLLRACAVSRQKGRYLQLLARRVQAEPEFLQALDGLAPDEVREKLLALTGVGPWTAAIYGLMALGHPDIWPIGDIALARGLQDIVGLKALPDTDRQQTLMEPCRPYRAAAARIVWQHYLISRGRPLTHPSIKAAETEKNL